VCGFIHLDPLPEQAALDEFYRSEYYQEHYAGWFEKERREWWYWSAVYQERVRKFERLHGPFPGPTRWLFDWGAGCGWFIKAARMLDPRYMVQGYEPNVYARQYAHKSVTALVVSTYAECMGEQFIHCSLVLEHVLDPLTLLREIHYRLADGGVACIVVPNEFNPLQMRLIGRYDYTPVHEHHINYFQIDSLRELAKRAGFSIVDTLTTVPVEWFALHGLNYVKRPALGAVVHWLRMLLEWHALTFVPSWWENKRRDWAAKGIGREVELWLQKSGS
jgi:SAM-dependent methyltransferase